MPPQQRKLGRKAVKRDTRTLRLSRYLAPSLPAPPISVDWSNKLTQFGAMLNTTLSCCTIAALGHAIQIWTANASTELTVPDSVIEGAYEAWCGYNPADPSTDQGGVELDVLKDFQRNGLDGIPLIAFADPNVSNLTEIHQAINLFMGLYVGMNVTNQVMNVDADDPAIPWDQAGDTSSAGGHAVYVVGYDAQYIFFISWGQIYKMTRAYWNANVDEAHALLSPVVIEANGSNPQGFNLTQLQADLATIN